MCLILKIYSNLINDFNNPGSEFLLKNITKIDSKKLSAFFIYLRAIFNANALFVFTRVHQIFYVTGF